MSFFEDASIVLIPSGIKNQKIYSVKPTDGTGDLTFTRASSATRVASNGLIEKVRTNELTYSNDFSNAAWVKTRSSVVSGQSGYDGTNNAWAYVDTTADSTHLMVQALPLGATLATFSIYAKAAAVNFLVFRFEGATGVDYAYFNLSNGTLGTIDSDYIDAEITPAGNGFYRCSVSRILGASGNQAIILSAEANNDPTYAGAGTTALILQNSQVELGDIATDYIPTTTAVSVGPVSGLPRLDYLGSTCGRLILEPQRTNSVISSESTATSWTFTNSSSAINQTASPDGYVNADSIVPNATSGQHAINSANITASGSFTLSAFVKAGEHTKVSIRESANTGSYASFNLATGTKIEDNVSGASFIQSYGNGWYRIGVTGTFSGTIRLGINVLSNAYTTGNPSSGTTFFAGNGTDKLFCWGMQCELGATYATSYIPTLGASVTRVADAASKTGISSLIGQTEGTVFVEVEDLNNFQAYIGVDNGSVGDRIIIYGAIDSKVYVQIRKSAATVFGATSGIISGKAKAAVAFNASGAVFYVNGTQIGSGSGTTYANTLVQFTMNHASQIGAKVNQALLFKTRLTNAQLAELTAL
jgi:hypothetical protein